MARKQIVISACVKHARFSGPPSLCFVQLFARRALVCGSCTMNRSQFNVLHYCAAFTCATLWAWAVTKESWATMPDPATMPYVHSPSKAESDS